MVHIHVNFEGGLQTDFNAPDGFDMEVPNGTKLSELPSMIALKHIDPNHPIRFINEQGHVVPGILIMVNDTDSEIEGPEALLKEKDVVTFISTLHGG